VAVTAQQLNRATLARQLLLERAPVTPVEAVSRVVALQAQEPASPYIALWNRIADFDPGDLDRAFADHEIVKATLMRVTLHAVTSSDHATFHRAMTVTLRGARLNDRRFRSTGLTSEDFDDLTPQVLDFAATPRTKEEVEAMLTGRLGDPPEPGVWWALRQVAPLIHEPSGPPWAFGRERTYTTAPLERIPASTEDAAQDLVRRYLSGFGPATAQDFAQFAMLRQPTVRPAFEALADELVVLDGPDGRKLFDLPGATVPDADTPAPPRLLGMWDSVLLSHVDRSRIVPEEYRKIVIRRNGDVLPTLLVDGYVCGVWRPTDGGIEVTAFHALDRDAWDGLAMEAGKLKDMLDARDRAVYGRYNRWWESIPSNEVRHLAG
jgi:DNA glycosylase AlkZ-like